MKTAKASLAALVLVTGCASVKVTRPDSDQKGFLTYTPVPHLLVERSKEGVSTTKVISLPDTSRPMYVEHHAGYGTLEFNFVMENGVLTTFGQKSDSKIPVTISSVASLGTLATGIGALHTALNPVPAAGGNTTKSLWAAPLRKIGTTKPAGEQDYEIDAVSEAIALLVKAKGKLGSTPPDASEVIDAIDAALDDKQLPSRVKISLGLADDPTKKLAEHLKPLKAHVEALTEAHALLRAIIDKSVAKNIDTSKQEQAAYLISAAIGRLQSLTPERSAVELYRIDASDKGVMYFTRVPLPFNLPETVEEK